MWHALSDNAVEPPFSLLRVSMSSPCRTFLGKSAKATRKILVGQGFHSIQSTETGQTVVAWVEHSILLALVIFSCRRRRGDAKARPMVASTGQSIEPTPVRGFGWPI